MSRRQFSPSLTELICNQDWSGVRSRARTKLGRREVRTPNPLGYPIHDACDYGAPATVIRALLEVYPEGSRKYSLDGHLPIHMEFLRYPFPRQSVIKALLDAYPDSSLIPNVSGRSWSRLFLRHGRNDLVIAGDQSSSMQSSSNGEEENRSSGSDRDSETLFGRRSSSLETSEVDQETKSQDSDRESDTNTNGSITSGSSDNPMSISCDGQSSNGDGQDSDNKSDSSERESVSTMSASDGTARMNPARKLKRNERPSYQDHNEHGPKDFLGRRIPADAARSAKRPPCPQSKPTSHGNKDGQRRGRRKVKIILGSDDSSSRESGSTNGYDECSSETENNYQGNKTNPMSDNDFACAHAGGKAYAKSSSSEEEEDAKDKKPRPTTASRKTCQSEVPHAHNSRDQLLSIMKRYGDEQTKSDSVSSVSCSDAFSSQKSSSMDLAADRKRPAQKQNQGQQPPQQHASIVTTGSEPSSESDKFYSSSNEDLSSIQKVWERAGRSDDMASGKARALSASGRDEFKTVEQGEQEHAKDSKRFMEQPNNDTKKCPLKHHHLSSENTSMNHQDCISKEEQDIHKKRKHLEEDSTRSDDRLYEKFKMAKLLTVDDSRMENGNAHSISSEEMILDEKK